MIKAVIFDCFGVLTNDGWLAFKNAYLDGPSQEEAIELNHQADGGYISQGQFEQELARLANVEIAVVEKVIDSHAPNDALFTFIQTQLKSRYKIGLLSNVSADYTPELFSPEQNSVFDAKTFSFEIGVIKPHHAMYESIAMKLDVAPEECLFIDDQEAFVQGAKDAGMQAFQFITTDTAIRDLTNYLAAH